MDAPTPEASPHRWIQAKREEAELDSRLAEWQENTAQKRRSSQGSAGLAEGKAQPSDAAGDAGEQRRRSPPVTAPRTLVDPESLMLVTGRMDKGSPGAASGTAGRATPGGGLNEPTSGSGGPQNRIPLRGYSDVDREDVGLELLRRVLGSDLDQIVDLRTQRGVGADAVDELNNYYELKVSAGSEPDQVTLTNSEAQRALTTPDFFLVVVSNIEQGVNARPTVRVVVDPLNQLRQTLRGTIALSGLREATNLVYEFAPIDDQRPAGEGE